VITFFNNFNKKKIGGNLIARTETLEGKYNLQLLDITLPVVERAEKTKEQL
jgi:hypothetical protein